MTIDYVREFIMLAKIKNYLAAADALFISQASLSRHIMALETALGFQLFERTTRFVSLTDAGVRFLPYAYKFVELQENCVGDITSLKKDMDNVLTIGFVNNVGAYGVTRMLGMFALQHPNIHIDASEHSTQQLIKLVRSGKFHSAFVVEPENNAQDQLKRLQIFTDELVAVLPMNHPLAMHDSISLDLLKDDLFIMPGREQSLYNVYMDACRVERFEPKLVNMSFHGGSAIDMVRYGYCVMLHHRKRASSLGSDNVKLVKILPEQLLYVNYIYNPNMISFADELFLNFLIGGDTSDAYG